MDFEKTNSIKIIGRLVDSNLKIDRRKDNGAGFITGTITLQSVIEGETKKFEISLNANELTQKKEPNKLYVSYSKLPELVGKKIEVRGEMRESRFWSNNSKQMLSSTKLRGRFVRGVAETENDMATFEFGGFVTSPLTEKKNKDNEIYRYDISVAQTDYSGNMLNVCTFHVKPTDREMIKGLQTAVQPGLTIRLNGNLDFTETIVTTQAKATIGTGAIRTYTNKAHNLWLQGADLVTGDGVYSQEVERDLISAYKARDEEIKINGESSSGDVEDKPAVTGRQSALI